MKKKILVVDDDKAMHAILRAVLQKDYEVLTAVDGLQGTTLAKQSKPDLVLLDLQMPAGGGQSVYERLRMMTDTAAIPILVLTASPLEEALHRVPGLSPEQVLTKPSSPKVILEAIAKSLAS